MTRILFWNLKKQDLSREVAALAKDKSIDLILLAEAGGQPDSYRRELGLQIPAEPFETPFTYYGAREKKERRTARLHILVRNSHTFWSTRLEEERFVIAAYEPPARRGILIAVAHLQTQSYFKTSSIAAECRKLARRISELEQKHETQRTLVVGDLNLDPFDEGIIGADSLHGVSSRELARKRSRTISGQEFRYFYNPMWNLFGDQRGTPGTYYYHRAEYNTQFWHIFDQVLIRPELLDEFNLGSLELPTQASGQSLLGGDGTPDSNRFSDHLPLVFEINLSTNPGRKDKDG